MESVSAPRLTTEAIIALAVGSNVPPPPLLLLQAGVDTTSDTAADDFLRLLDHGARNLGSLNNSVDLSDESRQQLWRRIVAMSRAERFVTLARSDKSGSRVVYCGEDSVVDDIDAMGNHLLGDTDGVEREIEEYFGSFAEADGSPIRCPADRFGPDAEPVDGEDPLLAELASSGPVDRLVVVGCPPQAKLTPLRWRSTSDKLFSVSNEDDDVIFTSESSQDAAAVVLDTLATLQAEERSAES